MNSELSQINRKTDSFFDWLGDWGGLQDGLSLLIEIILFAYQVYALKAKLASTFIRYLPSQVSYQSASINPNSKKAAYAEQFADSPDDPRRQKLAMNMMKYFDLVEKIKFSGFFKSLWERCR